MTPLTDQFAAVYSILHQNDGLMHIYTTFGSKISVTIVTAGGTNWKSNANNSCNKVTTA